MVFKIICYKYKGGCNNELTNALANILLLNNVWHTQTYRLKCSMRWQFGGYICVYMF